MEKLATAVIDFRDDVGGQVFRDLFPTYESIPEIVKTASMEEPREHEYALVMLNDGYKFKKFAMHDAGNTALSIIYLLRNSDQLPEEAVKVASEELINAAGRYKLPIPEELRELADDLHTKGVEVRTREKSWRRLDSLAKVDKLEVGTVLEKRANIFNGHVGAPPINKPAMDAIDHYLHRNTVDVSKKEAPSGSTTKEAKYTLLDGEYPVDTYEQVKMAQEYFQEYWREFDPAIRHEYCLKLAERMDELALPVPDTVARYAGQTYAEDVDRHLNHRRDFVNEELHPVIDTLIEKKAHVDPYVFAEALREFDKVAGLERHWESRLADPYRATFGSSKTAGEDWRYSELGIHLFEDDLKNLAHGNIHIVKKQFGGDFAARFMKEPKKAFESLDKDTKVILARMASHDH